ncbi:MAG: hypothetical protein PHH77_00775 [Victivallaceae bacterium]|nr:hypothetical protein [Victivallaceae bacterium]
MRKINLCLLLALVAVGMSWGKTGEKTPADKERERLIRQINATLEQTTVLEYLKKCVQDIQRGGKDGKALPTSQYSIYDTVLRMYSQHRWFIADTGLSREWFAEVRKLMHYLYITRDIIQTSIHNHQTETAKCKKAAEYFNTAYVRFAKLVDNPVKVPAKVQRQAQLQKVLWQKKMREKYKIRVNE